MNVLERWSSTGITFREDFKLWWPDYDHKPEDCFRRVKTRVKDVDIGVRRCRGSRVAVQAGGHVGEWPRRLARTFDAVHTFEAEPRLFECLSKNLANLTNVTAYPRALGATESEVMMVPHPSAGSWRVGENGVVPVRTVSIDSMRLEACDFICLDVEGYEVEVLRGALGTIEKFKPVLYVEQLDRAKRGIRKFMIDHDYHQVDTVHSDAVYVSAA